MNTQRGPENNENLSLEDKLQTILDLIKANPKYNTPQAVISFLNRYDTGTDNELAKAIKQLFKLLKDPNIINDLSQSHPNLIEAFRKAHEREVDDDNDDAVDKVGDQTKKEVEKITNQPNLDDILKQILNGKEITGFSPNKAELMQLARKKAILDAEKHKPNTTLPECKSSVFEKIASIPNPSLQQLESHLRGIIITLATANKHDGSELFRKDPLNPKALDTIIKLIIKAYKIDTTQAHLNGIRTDQRDLSIRPAADKTNSIHPIFDRATGQLGTNIRAEYYRIRDLSIAANQLFAIYHPTITNIETPNDLDPTAQILYRTLVKLSLINQPNKKLQNLQSEIDNHLNYQNDKIKFLTAEIARFNISPTVHKASIQLKETLPTYQEILSTKIDNPVTHTLSALKGLEQNLKNPLYQELNKLDDAALGKLSHLIQELINNDGNTTDTTRLLEAIANWLPIPGIGPLLGSLFMSIVVPQVRARNLPGASRKKLALQGTADTAIAVGVDAAGLAFLPITGGISTALATALAPFANYFKPNQNVVPEAKLALKTAYSILEERGTTLTAEQAELVRPSQKQITKPDRNPLLEGLDKVTGVVEPISAAWGIIKTFLK
jgi:hypothetical protein